MSIFFKVALQMLCIFKGEKYIGRKFSKEHFCVNEIAENKIETLSNQ